MNNNYGCCECNGVSMASISYNVPPLFLQQGFIRQVPGVRSEVAIPIPRPPGIDGVPGYIYFNVSGEFTSAQVERIKRALNGVVYYWYLHFSQISVSGTGCSLSQLGVCASANSTLDLQPTWYRGLPAQNGYNATLVAMDQFTQLIRDNGYGRAAATITPISTNLQATDSFVFAETATTRYNVPLSFQVNPLLLNNSNVTDQMLIGLFFHAWLHRAGFAHTSILPFPTGSFTIQSAICIMNGLSNNQLGDIRYFQ